MILSETAVAANVAGVNVGAGALDVVCVRDLAERDLSRNSTIVWAHCQAIDRSFDRRATDLGFGESLVSALDEMRERLCQWDHQSGHRRCCARCERRHLQLVMAFKIPFGFSRKKVGSN